MRDAVVIVIEREGRFVAIRRADGVARAGYWSPPTGRLEADETQADAARREAREELGITIEPIAKVWECDSDDGGWRLHWWQARTGDEVFMPAPEEVAAARWVTVAEFLALTPLFAQHREFFSVHYATLPQLPHAASRI